MRRIRITAMQIQYHYLFKGHGTGTNIRSTSGLSSRRIVFLSGGQFSHCNYITIIMVCGDMCAIGGALKIGVIKLGSETTRVGALI